MDEDLTPQVILKLYSKQDLGWQFFADGLDVAGKDSQPTELISSWKEPRIKSPWHVFKFP